MPGPQGTIHSECNDEKENQAKCDTARGMVNNTKDIPARPGPPDMPMRPAADPNRMAQGGL
jgi:hypothetical protein